MNDVVELKIVDGRADITLNRPAQLNALNYDLAERLDAILTLIARDRSIRVAVLKGAGRAFMAGGDVRDFYDAGVNASDQVERLIVPFHRIILGVRQLHSPVIASVHGAVAGGGLALALACDFVMASTDAIFSPAYLKIGASPDGGTTGSVTKLLGARRALEWLMLGDALTADEAMRAGLINRVVAPSDLGAETAALAARIAAGPAHAQASLKKLVWQAPTASLEEQLQAEAAEFIEVSKTADFREGVAAFVERRSPRFND